MSVILPLDDFRNGFISAGLYGISVAGATSPTAINGPWWYDGARNGKPSYTDGTYLLCWTAPHAPTPGMWQISLTVGGARIAYRANAALAGAYTNGTGTTGSIVVATDPVWPYALRDDTAQVVIAPVPRMSERDANNAYAYTRYALQVASWYPVRSSEEEFHALKIANERGAAVERYFDALKGTSTAAPGLQLDVWEARTVQVAMAGVVDEVAVTGGRLLSAICDIRLINFRLKEA